MYFLLGAIAIYAIGAISMFFVMRNNPKYFNIDDMLKAERYKLSSLGKEKLEALREKLEGLLK